MYTYMEVKGPYRLTLFNLQFTVVIQLQNHVHKEVNWVDKMRER